MSHRTGPFPFRVNQVWFFRAVLLILIGVPCPWSIPAADVKAGKSDARAALVARLKQLTDEVAASNERSVHGVNHPAHMESDPQTPDAVHTVVLNVNVFWCNDGCLDGPGQTPARDDDLALLLPFAKTLRHLDARQTEITDQGLATLAQLDQLETLQLSGSRITGGGLARLSPLVRLRTLDLLETRLDPGTLEPLAELTALSSIELPATVLTDETLAVLGRLPHLKALDLAKSRVTDRGLASLTELKNLERLDLSETHVSDTGLAALLHLEKLTRLSLARTRVTGPGLTHVGKLSRLTDLDLSGTGISDAHLASLSNLKELASLNLVGTPIQGSGLASLRACPKLQHAKLPPISGNAVSAVNSVKAWRQLTLELASEKDQADPASITLSDMPELTSLQLVCASPVSEIRIRNCPRLALLGIRRAAGTPTIALKPAVATTLRLDALPQLGMVSLEGSFDKFSGDNSWQHLTSLTVDGTLDAQAIPTILNCRALQHLTLTLQEMNGAPRDDSAFSRLSNMRSVRIDAQTAKAAWLTRLVGAMPDVEMIDLRIPGLNAGHLSTLAACTRVKTLLVRGIDDPGEPLTFLTAMPDLDQCLVLGCPRVGTIRLTAQTRVRRFFFKYGRIDSLEIDGAPNLARVALAQDAHGYNDSDARLNELDLGKIHIVSAPALKALVVNGSRSRIPMRTLTVGTAPQLESLVVNGPLSPLQARRCRLIVTDPLPKLFSRRLSQIAIDETSLNHLKGSSRPAEGPLDNVDVLHPDP